MEGQTHISQRRQVFEEMQRMAEFQGGLRIELFLFEDYHCTAFKITKINCSGVREELMLKIYKVQSEKSQYREAAQNQASILEEIKIRTATETECIHIVNIIDHRWPEPRPQIHDKLIVMEYCPNGNLKDFVLGLQRRGEWLSMDELLYLMQQLVKIVLDLHSTLKMMHRNIKLSNIYFDADFEVKLTDFRFSTLEELSADKVGSYSGMPPEIHKIPENVETGEDQQYSYNNKVDIYRLGVVIHFLAYGFFPQRSESYQWSMPQDEQLKVSGTPEQKKFIIAFLSNCLSAAAQDRDSSESWAKRLPQTGNAKSLIREQLRSKKNLYLAHVKKMFYIKKEEESLYLIILSNRRTFLLIENEKEKQAKIVQIKQGADKSVDKLILREYYEFMDQWRREASYDDYAGDTTGIQSVLVFPHNTVFLELSNSVMHHCFGNREERDTDHCKTIVSMRLNRLNSHEIIIGVPSLTPLQIYSSFAEALKAKEATEHMEYIRGRYLEVFRNEQVKLRKERNLVLK